MDNNLININFKKRETFVIPFDRADTQLFICIYVIKNYLAEEPEFVFSTLPDHFEGVSIGAYNAPFYGAVCGEIAVNIAVAAGKLDCLSGDLLLRLCGKVDLVDLPGRPVKWYEVWEAYEATEVKIKKYLDDFNN